MTPGATERPRVGYKNYSNKGTDHTVIGYMKH